MVEMVKTRKIRGGSVTLTAALEFLCEDER